MVRRIETLTDEQRATFPEWERRWLAHSLSTDPLIEEEWERVRTAAIETARFSGLPEPLLIRVPSPLAAAIAAPVAAFMAGASSVRPYKCFGVGPGVSSSILSGVSSGVSSDVLSGVLSGIESSVRSGIASGLGSGIRAGVASGVAPGLEAVWSSVESGVWSGVASDAWSGIESGVWSGVRSSVESDVEYDVWYGVASGVSAGIRSGVASGVRSHVWSGVLSGVSAGVWSDVSSNVRSDVSSGVESSVPSDVSSGVRFGVEAGIESLRLKKWLAEPITQGLEHARRTWYSAFVGGNLWAATLAWLSWFRDIGQLELDGDLWERYAALEGICLAGPSFWYRFGDQMIVAFSDRPIELYLDRNGNSHRDDGPAIVYADGYSINMWHGHYVPDDFFTWSVDRALREKNSETRRCALERIGWENLTDRLELIAEQPDPGNAPHTLALYDGELIKGLYAEPARLLIVYNGSVDKSGHRRRFGLPVPASVSDPIEAAALLFDVPADVYRQLERRT